MSPEQIDDPDVLAELSALLEHYEQAFMANDLAALSNFFWNDPRVTRYGIADRQWGHAELDAYRAATPTPGFVRRLEHPRILACGPDNGVTQVEFVRSDTDLRGFQTQVWVRFGTQWRIVAAHVSMIPWRP